MRYMKRSISFLSREARFIREVLLYHENVYLASWLIDSSKKAKKTMENKEELKEKTRKPKMSTRFFQCSSIRLTLIPS